MNWIDSRVDEGVTVGNCKINRLLFADDFGFASIFSTEYSIQHALDRFSAVCD